jgi:predicted ATP-grasp superfamily ATP-dependent carboligase
VLASNVDLVIPINSQELGPLLKNREAFGNALWYWGTPGQYELLHNKVHLQKALEATNVRMPRRYASLDVAEPPAVIKPVARSAARGVRYAWTRADLRRIKHAAEGSSEPILIQEYVEGEGVGLSGFFQAGKPLHIFAHRRLAEFPVSGGSSVYRVELNSIAEETEIRRIVLRVLDILPWSGFAMFEFKLTPAGELILIECNPRIWGSIHQGLAAGVNYFEPLLGPGKSFPIDSAVRTYLSPLIYVSLMQYLATGRVGPVMEFLRNVRANRADIRLFNDPRGWIAHLVRGA